MTYNATSDKGVIALSDAGAQSPPNALYAMTNGDPANAQQFAQVVVPFSGVSSSTTSLTLTADLTCATSATTFPVAGMTLQLAVNGSTEFHQIAMGIEGTAIGIAEGATPEGGAFQGYPYGQGNFVCSGVEHIVFTVTKTAATLQVNGTTYGSLDLTMHGFKFLPQASVQLGVGYSTDTAPVTVTLDNVVVTAH